MRLAPALAAFIALTAPAAAAPFEVSPDFSVQAEIIPGTYACRSGLDIDNFTYTFDLEPARYAVRGLDDSEGALSLDAEGTLAFLSGPFAPDDTAAMYGRSTRRASDGNPVIILGYFFADGTDSYDYCARLD